VLLLRDPEKDWIAAGHEWLLLFNIICKFLAEDHIDD
jgi:hypothetical protein